MTTDLFPHNFSLSVGTVSLVEVQIALLFLCCKTLLALSFFFELAFSSLMIFGCNKVSALGNSVFGRLPNNLWTGDDPILGEGVLRQSKKAKYGSYPLAFPFVSNFLAVFTAFPLLPLDCGKCGHPGRLGKS